MLYEGPGSDAYNSDCKVDDLMYLLLFLASYYLVKSRHPQKGGQQSSALEEGNHEEGLSTHPGSSVGASFIIADVR